MAEPSSPASSGGEGYTFEDRVGAWWLLHLLDGTLPFDAALGPVRAVRLQARADGDLLDDNVLDCAHGTARISVKSNLQISAQRAPTDFVEACWDQVVDLGNDFDPQVDRLVLICRGLTQANRQAKERALAAAIGSPERLLDRITVDGFVQKGARRFIDSFGVPVRLEKTVGDRRVGWLLQAVRVEDFDFRDSSSRMEALALQHAQRLVADGSFSSAEVLWYTLCQLVRDGSGRAAEYDLRSVVRHMRGKVALRHHPELAVYWEHLARRDESFVSRNRPGQGALPSIDRAATATELGRLVAEHGCTGLLGESGVGKSALLTAFLPEDAIVYRMSLDDLVSEHARWQHDGVAPGRLFESHPASEVWIVLDGAEWMMSEAQIRAVVDVAQALALGVDSPWRLVVSCATPHWHRVRRALGRPYGVTGSDSQPPVKLVVVEFFRGLSPVGGRATCERSRS